MKVFGEDPAPYLTAMKASLPCPVHPRAAARFEDDLRSYVNHDVYFFSDSEAKRKFDERPWKWSGPVTDPVTQERFAPTKESLRTDWMGRPYFFRSDSTRAVFLADPESHARARPMAADSSAASAAGEPAAERAAEPGAAGE